MVIKIAPYDHLTKQALCRKRLIDLPIFSDECFLPFEIWAAFCSWNVGQICPRKALLGPNVFKKDCADL